MNNDMKRFLFGMGIILNLIAVACNTGGGADRAIVAKPIIVEAPKEGLNAILATKDLMVGTNRIAFLLTNSKALITTPTVSLKPVYSGAVASHVEAAAPELYFWPFGSRGNYVTELYFDRPGDWQLDVEVEEDGVIGLARIPLHVQETSTTPSLGTVPPIAVNKTIRDVEDIRGLTTRSTPDRDLYVMTIAEALETEQPLLVVFASPALCTSPTCGPQVETVEQLKNQYKGKMNFIHVEVYDNPNEIQGDLSRAKFAPIIDTWGFTQLEGYRNESFVFIIDGDGLITSKYEGFATKRELEKGLKDVLD